MENRGLYVHRQFGETLSRINEGRDKIRVIVSHNHPSGSPKPGLADINETSNPQKALNALDINLPDHIIFADGRYFSFAEDLEFSLHE